MEEIDETITKLFEIYENPDRFDLNPDSFNDSFLEFITHSNTGEIISLSGSNEIIELNWDNRLEWVSKCEKFKLSEFDLQIKHIRKGICDIIPLKLGSVIRWSYIEKVVCGDKHINLSLLKVIKTKISFDNFFFFANNFM